MLLKLLLALLAVYLASVVLLFFAQGSMLFPTRLVPDAGPIPAGAERIEFTAPDGVRLEGVLIRPAAGREFSTTLILGFGGNASNAQVIAGLLHDLYPAHPVVAFHYRGYRPSGGVAGAEALLGDAPLLYDLARERVRADRVVAVGISLGSGVAAGLAARRPLDGLILVTPFDSVAAVAKQRFWWVPVSLLLRDDLDSISSLRGARLPVAIVAAGSDGVVPPQRTAALRQAVPNLVFDQTIPGTMHNDVFFHPAFGAAMTAALHRVEKASEVDRPR